MQYYPFDSRNALYKSKQTAVASGESLRLRLLLHKEANVKCAYLLLKNDCDTDYSKTELKETGNIEDYIIYETEVRLETGLYWYAFKFSSSFGECYVSRSDHSLGVVTQALGNVWQLTVYSADFVTPDSFAGGVIYQIFPDRFYASGTKKENIPDDRYIKTDWSSIPEYRNTDDKLRICNDYYGGDLLGITKKLPYLQELGVTVIYLNPIFEAHSNHRYNTADYFKIDPMLGTEKDFINLCKTAKKYGIKIILDGVFSHTGDDSVYFNKYGRYGDGGAYRDRNSKYTSWYKFNDSPCGYTSWWGVPSLPETNETDPSFMEFITGENGVLRYWIRLGASGWRLDVADELPDEFIEKIRSAVKSENPDALILGEVWEDASNKISYGKRRKFLYGKQLDSVMNYPLANLIIGFVRGGNARELIDGILDITENYPPQCVNILMNHIGTHDTARILTRLGDGGRNSGDREAQSGYRLTALQRELAKRRLMLASVLQYTLPGIPSLYYGDEAGVEGYGDPFCRSAFPWGNESEELTNHYKELGKLRKEHSAFKNGRFIPLYSDIGYVTYVRSNEQEDVLICINRWCEETVITLPDGYENASVLYGNKPEINRLKVGAESFAILCKKK